MENKVLKLLILAIGFLALLVISLAFLFGLALKDVKNSIQLAHKDSDIAQAIKSLKVINGIDGLSIVGPAGKDGKDSTSTIVIKQQPIPGPIGAPGKDGTAAPQIEFDGNGNWRYRGDEVWLPLFQAPPVVGAE
jgi:hypothetical protein